jgi:RNA recognition motif-containing protein
MVKCRYGSSHEVEIPMNTNRLFIKNLDSLTTEENIENLFSIYGDVSKIKVNRDRGTGFVEMTSIGEANRVRDNLDGSTLWGRPMKIGSMNDSLKHRLIFLFSKFIG